MNRRKTTAHYCDVRHRPGTTAEKMCPVHGRGALTAIPAGLEEQLFSGFPLSNAASREVESKVPWFTSSRFDGSKWVNSDGKEHRMDGPSSFFTNGGYGGRPEFLDTEWYINGRRASYREVLARYISAMSDKQIPAHDLGTVREIADEGVDIDPLTFKFTLNDKFDAAVQKYVDDHIGPNRRYERPPDDRVHRIPPDPDDPDSFPEWIDGTWSRHRPFGKAIETDDREISQYWWDGAGVSRSNLIKKSLVDASGGAISENNEVAFDWVIERIQVDDNGGELYLPAYKNVSWERIAEALLKQFPNPGPDDEYTWTSRDDYGEVSGRHWGKGGRSHRVGGPAAVHIFSDGSKHPTYMLDGKAGPVEQVMARYVSEKCGVEIADDNVAAIEFIKESGALREGDESNDWALVADKSLPDIAAIAASMYENPAPEKFSNKM